MYIPFSHIPLFLTLTTTLFLMQSTTSLPTTHSLPSIHPTPPPLNVSSNGNCASRAKYPSWTSPDWLIEDCYTVVQQLYVSQVHTHPKVVYEFLAQGLSPRQYPLAQRTPRKYIFRKWIGCCASAERERQRESGGGCLTSKKAESKRES